MRKSRKTDLVFTIITGVFFVAMAVLFFMLPTIDNMVLENPLGPAYAPLDLFVAGAKDLVSFNFASKKYLLVFGVGSVVGLLLIFWLIAIIVKKKPIKLIYWGIFFIMAAATGIIVTAYTISVCRVVTLDSGRELKQIIVMDLLNQYADLRDTSGNAPFIFYTFMGQILGIAVLGVAGLIAIFAVLAPFIVGLQLLIRKPYVAKEKPAAQPVEDDKAEKEALAKAQREAQFIAYVEYKAGKPVREKEYEELCRANGIALPSEEEDDEEYYRYTAAQLGCLHEQPVEEDSDEAYYRDTAAQLGCLHGQPEPEVVDEDKEYYEQTAKDLAVFRLTKASQNAKLERYYRDTIEELDLFSKDPDKAKVEAASNLKRKVAERRAYYEKLMEELPCLHYQKDPVEPDVGDDK